jgi:hypothetical protein
MMKLFAFRDRLSDPNKEFGRYHALDLYTILATTTEQEWEYALHLRDQYKDDPSAFRGRYKSIIFDADNNCLTIRN